VSAPVPKGASSVMAARRDPMDSLDFFPTPPWATRALLLDVLGPHGMMKPWMYAWEPAAGEGHMAEVLTEYLQIVYASDVHDYGRGYRVGSFVGQGLDVIDDITADWIITNPPFNLAVQFAERAIREAYVGTALLVRSCWAESAERYRLLFRHHPPTIIAQFCERVPMVKGRWDPTASTATAYAWFIWYRTKAVNSGTNFVWIPPGARERHTLGDDVARFATEVGAT
jgi:hypothetical protein